MFIGRPDIEPGIKIAAQITPEPAEDDLAFIRQMGVGYVVLWTDSKKASAEYYASRRKLFEDHGLKVYGFGNSDVHNQDAIVLGLENRDAKIEEYKQHLRNLGKAGIPYTTYAHMANGIWSTEREATRGGAPARAFNLEKADTGHWHGRQYDMPLTHGRKYSEDEIWDNFAYFIRQVVPVAEEAGVKIGIRAKTAQPCSAPPSWGRKRHTPGNHSPFPRRERERHRVIFAAMPKLASTPTIRPYRNWAASHAASSVTSRGIAARWKWPIVPTWACASASVAGWRAARGWARTSSRPSSTSASGKSCSRFTSAT